MKAGLIKLNGEVVRDLGRQIDPEKDKVEILGTAKKEIEKKITVAVNKPRGIVCGKNESEGETIFEFLPEFKDLNTVGRLDKESEGLILLSNDGVITRAVTGDHLIEKEYRVKVHENIRLWHIKKLEEGVVLEDGKTLPAKAEIINKNEFSIILKEGRKHQIRRMANSLLLTIKNLKRIRIGKITLKGIAIGKYRLLTKKEVESLKSIEIGFQ